MTMDPRARRFRMPFGFPVEPGTPAEAAPEEPGSAQPPAEARDRDQGRRPDEGDGSAPAFQGVYVISVASRILAMHPQTLRKYERIGLVRPSRSGGMLRLYSVEDIARLRMIKHLVEERGMNLAGVEMALDVVARLLDLRGILTSTMSDDGLGSALPRLDAVLRRLHFAVDGPR